MDADDFERLIRQAFKTAQASRAAKGLEPNETNIRRRRDGTRWVGPSVYRVTLYLQPWQYLTLIERKAASGFVGSLTKWLQLTLEAPHGRILESHRRQGGRRRAG